MHANRLFTVLLLSFLFSATAGSLEAQTVGGKGGASPVDSMVFPESPTTEDLIVFNLTADGLTHGNQCSQLFAFGGTAFNVTVDEASRTIQIGVTGTHSGICPQNFDPVNGLDGTVGPLAAGDWKIQTSFPGASPPSSTFGETLSFTVTAAPTVGGISGTLPVEPMVVPESPTTEDLIVFQLTADSVTHGNQCEQLRALGGAQFEIVVDEASRTIQIGVTGTHPGFCPRNFDPVNGLEGTVGPLAAGDWKIQTSFPGASPPSSTFGETLSFTVTAAPTVGGISGTLPVEPMVVPESPTTEDLIVFQLTADRVTHGNQCEQLRALGGAQFEIVVDEASRTIQIGVTGTHPGFCSRNFDPVNGLEGTVGPLAAGDWKIQTSFPGASPPSSTFGETLSFTVTPAPVLLGDVNLDGAIDFSDIPAFIAVLLSGVFQANADCNEDGGVDFSDIPTFIEILLAS